MSDFRDDLMIFLILMAVFAVMIVFSREGKRKPGKIYSRKGDL